MTTFNYPATAATSARLLERFGAACVLKRQTAGTYDPATGTTPVTTDSLPTTAAVFAYEQSYIDGTLIKQGDQRAYCAPAVEPRQGDRFTWAGRDYAVVAVKPVSPAGVPVLFEAQLRGS
ncbi:MAG: hypothetical protein J0M19_16920 [Sphingomonadales bacterium]|nr:hypothetical protein [Sphingomonadales bacterium]